VPVLLLLTAAAITVAVLVVAIGRGGEMTTFPNDTSPVQAEVETAADIALLRPPWALWGYQVRATDEVLGRIAQTVTERDVEIAILRRQLAELQWGAGQQTTAGPPGVPDRYRSTGQQAAADHAASGPQAAAGRRQAAGREAAGRHIEPGEQRATGQQQRGAFEPTQKGRTAKDDGPSLQARSPEDPQ
jgi:hypothetical protein